MQVVGRNIPSPWRLHALDAAGGALGAMLIGSAAWIAFVHVGGAAQEMVSLREQIESTRQTLATVETAALRQGSLVEARTTELGDRGRLPSSAPIEEYLSVMSAAAAAHQLTVVGHALSAQRRYGDVIEQCVSFQVQGAAPNLLRFLREVEESEFWADVGYLRVEGGDFATPHGAGLRRASLTFSLFAAAAAPPPGAAP